MTTSSAPTSLPFILDEPSIACEWPACDTSAAFMVKGCYDARHWALCSGHLRAVQDDFFAFDPYPVCVTCHRPLISFGTHFDVQGV